MNKNLYTDFERWLKENKVFSEYRCDSCGHSQGHQLIYCPKCGNKVIHRKNVSYWDCIKYGDLKKLIYFKMEANRINDGYVNSETYNKMCDDLVEIYNNDNRN